MVETEREARERMGLTEETMLITLYAGRPRRQRRQVDVYDVEIPDLWHVAQTLKGREKAKVLECWHLCHDLLRTLTEIANEKRRETNRGLLA